MTYAVSSPPGRIGGPVLALAATPPLSPTGAAARPRQRHRTSTPTSARHRQGRHAWLADHPDRAGRRPAHCRCGRPDRPRPGVTQDPCLAVQVPDPLRLAVRVSAWGSLAGPWRPWSSSGACRPITPRPTGTCTRHRPPSAAATSAPGRLALVWRRAGAAGTEMAMVSPPGTPGRPARSVGRLRAQTRQCSCM